jgi:hypothetical protein
MFKRWEESMPRVSQHHEAHRPEEGVTVSDHTQAPEEQPDVSPSRQPDHKVQMGRVQGSVWSKEMGDGRTAWSVSLSRSYQDRDGRWQRTHFLDNGDLLPASQVLESLYRWIQERRQHDRQESLQDLKGPRRAANS